MSTTNLSLTTTSFPTDGGKTVEQWILELTGASNSNMTKIDDYAGETDGVIDEIKGAGWTSQTIKGNADAITALNGRVTYTVSPTGTNTLTATISQIPTPLVNSIIKLIPTANNTGAMTLNVNGEGALPVTKVRTVSGSLVYSPMEANDFRTGSQVLVTKSSDGVRWISLTHGEIFARNIYYDNGDGTYSTVQSKLDEATTPDANTISLTELAQISTVTDSYASPSDLTVGGASLNQAVVNGDFANGTTGWSVSGSTISVANKILTVTGNGANALPAVAKLLTLNGAKRFYRVRARVTNSLCTRIELRDTNGVLITFLNTPIANVWYNLFLTGTPPTEQILIGHRYADAATANGKVMEVAGNVGVFAIPITGTPYENYTADQMNALVNEYFEGLKGAKDVVVGSRGRNLINPSFTPFLSYNASKYPLSNGVRVSGTVSGAVSYVSASYKLKPLTQYTVKSTMSSADGRIAVRDSKDASLGFLDNTGSYTFTTDSTGKGYFYFYAKDTAGTGTFIVDYTNLMLNEGSTALVYEPFQESKVTISATRHKLPNLVEDTLEFKDGKFRFNKRTAEYTLQSGDIDSLYNATNIQRLRIPLSKLVGIVSQSGNNNDKSTLINGFAESVMESTLVLFDVVGSAYGYGTDTTHIYLFVPLGTYANLAAAQSALAGTKIVYQLATPLIIEEKDFAQYGITVDGSLSSNLDYTEYFVSDYDIFAPVGIEYATNISKAVEQLKDSADGLREAVDGKASKVQEPPIAPTLLNGWVNSGGTDPTVAYYKDELGVVHLQGQIKSGVVTDGTMLFKLPVGYRQSKNLQFPIMFKSPIGVGTLSIVDDVVKIFDVTSNAALYLNGISFRTEA